MAVAEIGNLATILLNQLSGRHQNASANTTPAVTAHASNANVLPEDRFTPSAQQNSVQTAAQQAGLFQVTQFPALSVAINISQTQPTPPQTLQDPPSAQVLQPVAAPAPSHATPQIADPATAPTTALAVQDELQALNIALAALGLSNSEIQSLDRVASIVKDFDPVAYRNLAFQLKAVAQQAASLAAANAGKTATAASGAAPANETNEAAA